jgi:hypothetical protein
MASLAPLITDQFRLAQNALGNQATADQADYNARFRPLEDTLTNPISNRADEQAAASARVSTAFSGLPGMLTRRRAGFGIATDERQAASERRRIGLSRAIADADAQTRAGWKADKENRAQLRSAQDFAFDAYAQDLGQARSMVSGVAQNEAQREQIFQSQWDEFQKQKARRRGGILGLAGTLIGFAVGGPAGATIGGAIGGAAG